MDAPSREAVFESLRARGIRPIKVVAADGSKANGEQEEGRSKRGKAWRYAAFVVLVSLISLISFLSLKSLLPSGSPPAPTFETAQTRRCCFTELLPAPLACSGPITMRRPTGRRRSLTPYAISTRTARPRSFSRHRRMTRETHFYSPWSWRSEAYRTRCIRSQRAGTAALSTMVRTILRTNHIRLIG